MINNPEQKQFYDAVFFLRKRKYCLVYLLINELFGYKIANFYWFRINFPQF